MFGNKTDNSKRHEPGISLIASNCELTGDIQFSDQLQIDGTIHGNIHALPGSKATVTVSEKGMVKGELRVPNIVVNGEVQGDIHSAEHLELAAKARVKGRVYYNFIEMVKGARMVGELIYAQDDVAQKADGKPEAQTDESVPATRREITGVTRVTPISQRGN